MVAFPIDQRLGFDGIADLKTDNLRMPAAVHDGFFLYSPEKIIHYSTKPKRNFYPFEHISDMTF